MGVLIVVLIGVVILAGAAVVLTLSEGGLHDEPLDHHDLGLPDRPLTADDIASLHFRTGARGYRMQDVDDALERITQTLRASQPPLDQ